MAKSKTEIHVTTVFDGELDATDVFVSLNRNTAREMIKNILRKSKIWDIIKTRFRVTVFRLDCAGNSYDERI